MSSNSIIVDIGQCYTKAGMKIENIPLKVFKTYHHLIFENVPGIEEYDGFKCGRDKVLANLPDRDAYNVVHEYIDYLFFEYSLPNQEFFSLRLQATTYTSFCLCLRVGAFKNS